MLNAVIFVILLLSQPPQCLIKWWNEIGANDIFIEAYFNLQIYVYIIYIYHKSLRALRRNLSEIYTLQLYI